MISNWWHRALARKATTYRRDRRAGQPRLYRPMLELLEDRNLMTTFLVINVNEDGAGSFRQAILDANAAGGPDDIKFEIPANLGTIIQLTATKGALNTVLDQVTIDGANKFGGNIRLTSDGSFFGDGLTLSSDSDGSASDSIIRGLTINGFKGHGVVIESSVTRVLIEGNFIGTNSTGAAAVANTGNGILIQGDGNTVGGTGGVGLGAGKGNLVSGNGADGILLGSDADFNLIQGNYIGTDVAGTSNDDKLGNGGNGITVQDSKFNTIGGPSAYSKNTGLNGTGNLISNNIGDGILIQGPGFNSTSSGFNNVVQGNFIGTDITGVQDLGNGGVGVHVINSSRNLIGGSSKVNAGGGPFLGNLISGNGSDGIKFDGSGAGANFVQGNFIGTDITGKLNRRNDGNGVLVTGGAFNAIVGGDKTQGNLIAGNKGDGVRLDNANSSNFILGNTIGGAPGLGNSGNGVAIINGDSSNSVGGTGTGDGNVISFNGANGVLIGSAPNDSATSNSILGNAIFSNGKLGIDLGNDGVTQNDAVDPDKGANDLQNFPVLKSIVLDVVAGTATITFDFDSIPGGQFTLGYIFEFFANTNADPSGFGEGERSLGFQPGDVGTDLTFVFDIALIGSARFFTATATVSNDGFRSTSEFSAALDFPIIPIVPVVGPGGDPIVVKILQGQSPPVLPLIEVAFQEFTVSNLPPPPTLRQVRVLAPLQVERFQNLVDAPGEIHGQILDDPNSLGKPGPDTFPLHGQPVFLDFNRNGVYDDGEPITVTNSKGEYTFTSLTPGQYTVHLVLGRTQDVTFSPKQDNKIELRSGSMIVTNVNFGVRFRARRGPGSRTALPWNTDGVLLADGSVLPAETIQFGLDLLPLSQERPAPPPAEEPSGAGAELAPAVDESEAPVSGMLRWCGWLLGAAVLAPWQQLANRRKSQERRAK